MTRLIEALLILSLSSLGLCCNKGWYQFERKCYTKSHNMYSLIMAERYCQMAQARLAQVTSTAMLRYLGSMPNFDGNEEYWVSGDSTLHGSGNSTDPTLLLDTTLPATPSSLCPYVKILELKLEYCTEKKYFICEMEAVSNICQKDFDNYGGHCYRAITQPSVNFDDATRFCALQKSHLAILDIEEKEYEAKAAVIGKNETFYVSAKKKEGGIITWSNEKAFIPIHDLFANSSDGDCVAFVSSAEHPLLFSWVHVDCGNKYGYLCESDPLPPKEERTTTTTPSTTTQGSLECPHGYNWKSHEESGYCYWETTYETERLNWFQARKFCKLYGGDLASYDHEEQEIVGLGGARGHYRGLWIGLKRDENNVFHWIDGNTLTYTNWAMNEPNLNSSSKFCVAHTSSLSKWGLDYCGVRRWFICKAPKVRNPVLPDMPSDNKRRCDIRGPSTYNSQWYEYENNCYLLRDLNKYTWDTARSFCQDNEAHLISIHSYEETNFLLSMISGYPDTNFWIGLSTEGPDTPFEWSDRSALDFIYWSDTRKEIKDFDMCVTFNNRDGSWDVEHCNRLQGVICKRGVNSSVDFATTAPTTAMPGNCENGWYNLGNKCYSLFGTLWSQRLPWTSARRACENHGASLASIHNKEEQEFLTDLVLEGYADAWIGLVGVEGGNIFNWADDTRLDYTNWNANEPNGYSAPYPHLLGTGGNACVQMEYSESNMGKWDDMLCSDTKAYICQKMKDPTITEYIDPSTCPNITGWLKLGSSCYGIFEQYNKTWMDAQRECRKYSANLVSYKNSAVTIFVKRKLTMKNAFYWTGVREKMENNYEYVTGQALFYTNWMANQPRAASSFMDNCVATSSGGEWLVKSCKEKHPFICQIGRETEPKIAIDRSHMCGNVTGSNWKDFGGNYCYLIEADTKMSWTSSMHYCYQHGGYLASFHSIEEINKVLNSLDVSDASLHIGLMRKKDGTVQWVDRSPVNFLNWDGDEQDQLQEQEEINRECVLRSSHGECKECVTMSGITGKWSYATCNLKLTGFVCAAPKARSLAYSESAFTEDEIKDTVQSDTEKKLIVGGIFGFVLCVLVILAVIGLIVYYLKIKKEVKPSLLEQDNL